MCDPLATAAAVSAALGDNPLRFMTGRGGGGGGGGRPGGRTHNAPPRGSGHKGAPAPHRGGGGSIMTGGMGDVYGDEFSDVQGAIETAFRVHAGQLSPFDYAQGRNLFGNVVDAYGDWSAKAAAMSAFFYGP